MKLFVELSFGGAFDPEELSQLVGFEPTRKNIGRKANSWCMVSDTVEDGGIDALCSACVAPLLGHEAAIVAWMVGRKVDPHLLIALETPPPGTLHEDWPLPPIVIPSEVIRFLGAVGASIDVDEEYF